MIPDISIAEIALRLVVAAALSGLVGLEREPAVDEDPLARLKRAVEEGDVDRAHDTGDLDVHEVSLVGGTDYLAGQPETHQRLTSGASRRSA